MDEAAFWSEIEAKSEVKPEGAEVTTGDAEAMTADKAEAVAEKADVKLEDGADLADVKDDIKDDIKDEHEMRVMQLLSGFSALHAFLLSPLMIRNRELPASLQPCSRRAHDSIGTETKMPH